MEKLSLKLIKQKRLSNKTFFLSMLYFMLSSCGFRNGTYYEYLAEAPLVTTDKRLAMQKQIVAGVGKSRTSNADQPSPDDQKGMENEEMSIIVGKKSEGNVTSTNGVVTDDRPQDGTIEIYNKDYKLKSYGSISGKNADAILEDYESR